MMGAMDATFKVVIPMPVLLDAVIVYVVAEVTRVGVPEITQVELSIT